MLSKYVLALVQNNPEEDGLEATCVAKLEEFLGDGVFFSEVYSPPTVCLTWTVCGWRTIETRGFVSKLFKALATGAYKAGGREGGEEEENMDDERYRPGSSGRASEDDSSRRRPRTASEDEDERRRFNKRRRDDDRGAPSSSLRHDARRYPTSPRRDNNGSAPGGRPRQPFGPRDGSMMPMGGGGYGMGDRRRNYPPEWGMPPPQHMWPPHFPPPQGAGGYPMPPDFDPNVYNPDNPAMAPPMGMMMPPMGGRGQFYPPNGGRGGRGGRGRGGGFYPGRGVNGEPGKHGDAPSGAAGENGNGYGQPPMAKTTLRVSNVDPRYVNMTKLSLHFSKFGNVVNVQMRPAYKCAYVQYATEEEAKKAFHSPIPVCNNRFIEVKWARYDAKGPDGAPPVAEQDAAESKEGDEDSSKATAPPASSTNGDEASAEAEAAKEMTPEELRAAALEKGRKVLEEKRELLEKQRQLKKQKEELIKRQLAQQKEMLERMSRNSGQFSAADKRDLLNKITALSEELKTLASSHRVAAPEPTPPSTGDNINGLKAELSALEAEASTAGGRGGVSPYGGRGFRGGRGYRGRGVGGRGGRGYGARGPYANQSHTLDNRTTIVRVANLPEEARDPMVLEQHFGNFGAIERVVLDKEAPTSGFIKFQDRYSGQAALNHGKSFGEATLEMAWVEPQDAPRELAPTPRESPSSADATSSSTPSVAPAAAAASSDSNEVRTSSDYGDDGHRLIVYGLLS